MCCASPPQAARVRTQLRPAVRTMCWPLSSSLATIDARRPSMWALQSITIVCGAPASAQRGAKRVQRSAGANLVHFAASSSSPPRSVLKRESAPVPCFFRCADLADDVASTRGRPSGRRRSHHDVAAEQRAPRAPPPFVFGHLTAQRPRAQPYKKESTTYCDVCKVWISNHSVAIRNHENGSGHKEKMQQSAFARRAPRCALLRPRRPMRPRELAALGHTRSAVPWQRAASPARAAFRAPLLP